jgi:hypothetical protein
MDTGFSTWYSDWMMGVIVANGTHQVVIRDRHGFFIRNDAMELDSCILALEGCFDRHCDVPPYIQREFLSRMRAWIKNSADRPFPWEFPLV